jgi:hypothetical protein
MVATAVLLNYTAQVPYAIHLYGPHVFARTTPDALFGITLCWFVLGLALLLRGSSRGFWLLFSFLATEFAFYLHNESVSIPHGYGLPYQLRDFHDLLLWFVFLIGGINFVADGYFLWYLCRRRPPWREALAADEIPSSRSQSDTVRRIAANPV